MSWTEDEKKIDLLECITNAFTETEEVLGKVKELNDYAMKLMESGLATDDVFTLWNHGFKKLTYPESRYEKELSE